MELDLGTITAQARQAAAELLEVAKLEEGALFVVGCSSSEIVGGQIGHASSLEAAQAVFAGIYPLLRERGIWLAAQCCEHLNRALILERDCARQYGYDPVCVVPQPKAGGVLRHHRLAQLCRPRGGGAHPGPRGTGHRRHPHRDAPAGCGGAGAAEFGPHRPGHPVVCPHPAQAHRGQQGCV